MWLRLTFLLPLLPLATQNPTLPLKEKCAIEGAVLTAAAGTPLAGAEVIIEGSDNVSMPPLMVMTDTEGHYAVQDIEPGRYWIRARRQGYVVQTYGQRRRNNEGLTLSLEPGMRMEGIVFRLVQTGVITGKVLDEKGEPLVGAAVQVLTPRYIEGERRLIAGAERTRTNDLGEYRIHGLPPDRYYVGVSGQDPNQTLLRSPKNAVSEERYVPALYQNSNDVDHATIIDVSPGREVRGIDIVVTKSRTFYIRGRLKGFGKDPGNVQLEAVGVRWEIGRRGAETTPNSEGDFEFGGLIPGLYVISGSTVQSGAFLTASRLVQVKNSDIEEINLVPSPGILRGHVRIEGSQKIDFRGFGVQLDAAYLGPPSVFSNLTKPVGNFAFYNVGQYQYRVSISCGDDLYVKSVQWGYQEISDGIIDLTEAGEAPGTLEITLSGDGGRIEGVVTNDEGVAESNAVVVLVPDSRLRSKSELFKNTTTNQRGQFLMRGIRPGSYKLFAWNDIEPGMWWDKEFVRRYEEQGEEITVDANSHVNHNLHVISVD